MDRATLPLEYLQQPSPQRISPTISLIYGLAILYLALIYFRCSPPDPQHLVWDALVYIIPQRLLLSATQRGELQAQGMLAQTHAAKKEALRAMLGLGSATLLSKLPASAGQSIGRMRSASTTLFSKPQLDSDLPPGLGNWDNSCYQNVVLQGLASLESLKPYLTTRSSGQEEKTGGSLLAMIEKLNDPANNGRELWTPAKLKSMSSWQQQDAQEYYSKILDEIDKETCADQKAMSSRALPGLETLTHDVTLQKNEADVKTASEDRQSPLNGLLAQKVMCTRCGYSEGLSMIPFNCLTLPLAVNCNATGLQDCLDEYTKIEEIAEVECAKCTLVRAREQLTKMLPANPSIRSSDEPSKNDVDPKVLQLPPELRAQAFARLATVQKALDADDFADKTLDETCQIGKKARVSSTKTKEIVIARAPRCLVAHVNRSVFDEQTGVQRKNYARVRYPLSLDLYPWVLNEAADDEPIEGDSILYSLKAVVAHSGRHENGHYICFRQHPSRRKLSDEAEDDVDVDERTTLKESRDPWYRLSDEDVSAVDEDTVLGQGGVFMLFYERDPPRPLAKQPTAMINTEAVAVATDHVSDTQSEKPLALVAEPIFEDVDVEDTPAPTSPSSTGIATPATGSPIHSPSTQPTTTEDEFEPFDSEHDDLRKPSSASPLLMRTARVPVVEREFAGNAFRAVAAT